MLTPFQCDLCQFRNMQGREPREELVRDERCLICVRSANIDAFWARETRTVGSNLSCLQRDYREGKEALGLVDPLPSMGPMPLKDSCGMKAAVLTLRASLRKGKYANHLQWDSMRATPAAWGNMYGAGINSVGGSIMAKDDKKLFVTSCPTRSLWFERFMRGTKLRMGVERRQNFGLSSEALHALLGLLETDWRDSDTEAEKKAIEELAVFVIAEYCGGLRGEEVPLLSLKGMLTFWEETRLHRTPHVMMALKGRFKGETGERWHLLPVADETRTRVPGRLWFGRLLQRLHYVEGRETGWVFARRDGKRAKFGDYDNLFKHYMVRVKAECPGVIPDKVNPAEDMSLWRSGRRGSNTETANQNLDTTAIELNNRWRKRERARGTEPGMSMRAVYTQVENALASYLRYSQVL